MVRCAQCDNVLHVPVKTTKFKCIVCSSVHPVSASTVDFAPQVSTGSTPEDIFERARKTETIVAQTGEISDGEAIMEQLIISLLREVRELRRNASADEEKARPVHSKPEPQGPIIPPPAGPPCTVEWVALVWSAQLSRS